VGDVIHIYGAAVRLPDEPPKEEILYYDLPSKKQKWVKEELPDFFDTVELDGSGDMLLNLEQRTYADREVRRCKQGVWAMIGGKLRYITGRYYFFLRYYTLEDGTSPDFREADRLYFLFFHFWFMVEWCLGIIRTKKRRQGASSQSCSNILYEAIFYRNSNCGLISKSKDDSKATFTEMVSNAYQQLPIYLKPKQVNKEDSVTELVFAHKADSNAKGKVVEGAKKKKGNNSKINYKAPVLNAYDRGRMSYVLGDEFGKLDKDVPASRLLAIISKTLVKGVKRVGWIDLPSTTNEMLKGGGMEYYKIWKAADQSRRKPTINRLVRFFQPAYEAYEGFIDEYGDSVINAPTEEQYEYLVNKWVRRDPDTGEVTSELTEDDIRLGAKYYVQVKRREGLEGIDLEEEMRMNPCNEEEAFMAAVADCVFNSVKIKQRQKQLENNPIYKRKIVFYRNEETQKVAWRDINDNEKNFHWQITWGLNGEFVPNSVVKDSIGRRAPGRSSDGAIAVDSYSNSQGGRKYGSKACALIGRRSDLLDPENTGKVVGMLYGRPLEKDSLHKQVLLAAEYFGYPIWYEHTADDYDGYFKDRGKLGYLGVYPKSMIDPTKRQNADRHRGTPITPFSLTKQLDNAISYFEHHTDKIDWEEILDNALIFDPQDRTAYDIVVSFLILVSVLMERPVVPPPKKKPIIQVYENGTLVSNN
jgi:hypothetical protein